MFLFVRSRRGPKKIVRSKLIIWAYFSVLLLFHELILVLVLFNILASDYNIIIYNIKILFYIYFNLIFTIPKIDFWVL